jgi:3',5'-cyclic AMP phosphodiesterase CpdA
LTASVICRQLRQIATKTRKTFIFAGVHDHFLPDLWPDVVVVKSHNEQTRVIAQNPTRSVNSKILEQRPA